jgi:hypothetical protein
VLHQIVRRVPAPGVQVLQDLVKGVGGGHDLALVP